ncbi:hypothetical protein [Albibacillus kandeliae]|jgi:hypothetical protein|uniref:hypothetical protein n=1 Tax=Albibacillus kandeliae TaxID=2174228 RepID=UPI000D69215D|nr:hypothetical protein [Albibacillus kandeliae]
MTRLIAALLLTCAACVPQDVAQLEHRARFDSYPTDLFSAFEEVCSQPADKFHRLDRNSVECRSYLSPDATAAMILRYGGTTESLPQLVLRINAQPDDPGYVVVLDAYLNVPQKHGQPVRVKHRDAFFTRKVNDMMRAAGGVPQAVETS